MKSLFSRLAVSIASVGRLTPKTRESATRDDSEQKQQDPTQGQSIRIRIFDFSDSSPNDLSIGWTDGEHGHLVMADGFGEFKCSDAFELVRTFVLI